MSASDLSKHRHRAQAGAPVSGHQADAWRRTMWLVVLAAVLFALYLGMLPFYFRAADMGQVLAGLVESARRFSLSDTGGGLVGHATALGIIAFMATGAAGYRRSFSATLRGAALAMVIVVTLALAIEVIQGFTPFRTVSAGDAVAGIFGGAIGALAWLLIGERLAALANGLRAGSLAPLSSAVALYSVIYLVLSFFPFDFMLSPSAWLGHLANISIFGGATADRNTISLLAGFLAALPVGLFLGIRVGDMRRAMVLAVVAGLAVECLQVVMATGNLVVMAGVVRAAGMVLGARLAGVDISVGRLRQPGVGWGLAIVTGLYILGLTVASGWYRAAMPGWAEVERQLAHTSYLPFFYHALEADLPAVASLVFVAAAYAVLGLLWRLLDCAWRRTTPAPIMALAGALLAAGMEFGGLFLAGQRMDASTPVIALVMLPLAYRMAGLLLMSRQDLPAGEAGTEAPAVAATFPQTRPQGMPNATPPRPSGSWWAWGVAALAGMACLLFVIDFPIDQAWLLVGFAAYAAVLWRYPEAWLVVLPAALPVFDLAPWSGRFFLTEFDILVLISLAMALLRAPKAEPALRLGKAAWWWIALLTLSYGVSLIVGLLPVSPLDANAFSSYYSSFNSLRVGKGYFEALLLLPFLLRALRTNPRTVLLLSAGMVLGVLLNGLVVLFERYLLLGLFNFSRDYRATGLFSSMHIGGAYLDAYLMATAPFLAVLAFLSRRLPVILAMIGLFGLTLVAILTTASRAPLVALVVMFVILAGALVIATRRRVNGWVRGGVIGLFAVMAVISVLLPLLPDHSFIRERFAASGADSLVRVDHWEDTLGMMSGGVLTDAVGMGLGAYPRTYFWVNRDTDRLATYGFQTAGDGNRYLRLGAGNSLYVSQNVPLEPETGYVISARLRTAGSGQNMIFPICEKWLISSWECEWQSVKPETTGDWQPVNISFNSGDVGSAHGQIGDLSRRPVKFTLYNPGPEAVDIDDISLRDATGRSILQNGDFTNGLDHWFFTVDDHLPWHAKNVLIHMIFEQGILGLVAFVGLGGTAILALMRNVAAGDRFSAVLLTSVVGLGIIGGIDSLVDDPRTALLYYLLIFTALGTRALAREAAAKDPGSTAPSST